MSSNVNPILTFFLPLGSALILSGFISFTSTYETMMFLGERIFIFNTFDGGKGASDYGLVNFSFRVLELVSHIVLLWFGTIIKRKKYCLIAWLIGQCLFLFVWETELLVEICKVPFKSWTFSFLLATVFAFLYQLIIYLYVIHVGYQCISRLMPVDHSGPSDLEPVGKSLGKISEFYKINTWAGATLALMMETILNLCAICVQIQSNFEDAHNTADIMENIFVRYSRFLLAIVGFCLLQKDKRQPFLVCCFGYFFLILMSAGIYIYSVGQGWRYQNRFAAIHYYTSSSVSVVFRGWVLIACLRFLGIFETNQTRPQSHA